MPPPYENGFAGPSLSEYQYQELRSDPIDPKQNRDLRLIYLKPAASPAEALNCTLIVVNANSPPRYEAISWCWGKEACDQQLRVTETREDGIETVSQILMPNTLAKALRTLRKKYKSRALWIDFICINQADIDERNLQVPMMHKIYNNARNVCIWLDEIDIADEEFRLPKKRRRYSVDQGSSDDEAEEYANRYAEKKAEMQRLVAEKDKQAIEFIKHDVLKLWNFDSLCKNKTKADEWACLLSLMRKPWFSRRWVVQEIALAREATIYTGSSRIPWRDFVDAVSLFVEIEDATHRLTEIMQRHEVYSHVPDFFEDLSAIGASLLVKATSNLYRRKAAGKDDDQGTSQRGESQKTLEYLISALPVFDVTDPRDAVYSLLAISKATSPLPANQKWKWSLFQRIVQKGLDRGFTRKAYKVDYRLNVVDVFKDFVQFSIRRSIETDPTRALDIICRPWAPDPNPSCRWGPQGSDVSPNGSNSGRDKEKLPSWIMGPEQAAFKIYNHPNVGRRMGRINADPLVGLPDERVYRACESRVVNEKALKFKKTTSFFGLFVEGFVLDKINRVETFSQNGQIPWEWLDAAGWKYTGQDGDTPPEDFWRTLVGDRSQYGRNAPAFFERACHESVRKERSGETIDAKKLITEGRCSIIAAFLRRVQAVIWNRRLAKSTRLERLCMTPKATKKGNVIAILYGCSVPVVLRSRFKTNEEMEDEIRCDEKIRNKPREDAARKIAAHFRRRQKANELAAQREEIPTAPVPLMIAELEKKKARWEKIHKETKEIIEDEEGELLRKIHSAQQLPPDDVRRQYFELVGPCYVHGMMNGEAIEEYNLSTLSSQVFEIH